MTDPYKNIPYVAPGSPAAGAVDEVSAFWAENGGNVSPAQVEQFVKHTLESHGTDPVTAAASARTASLLAEQNPGGAQAAAENVVGVTLADPARAADSARDQVDAELARTGKTADQLSREEKIALAEGQAKQSLATAGIPESESSGPVSEAVSRLVDQGVAPDLAAAAAVSIVLGQMMPSADSFSIFGYLTMLVHGDAEYNFLNTESLKIANSAIHTNMTGTTYDMSGHDISLYTHTIKTKASKEEMRSRNSLARGEYHGTYESFSPISISFYWLNMARRGWQTRDLGLASMGISGLRVYFAGYDSDVVLSAKADSERDYRASLLDLYMLGRDKRKARKTHIK